MVKICPECGRKYPEDHNFCSKHSKLIKLVHIDELVNVKVRLQDTDDKIYESNQKKIMMIVKGDILHKVRLNETRHNKKSGSLWDMIKQCVKGSMKRR